MPECPECGTPISRNAAKCVCGWNQRQARSVPSCREYLHKILTKHKIEHGKLPDPMPQAPGDAISWWYAFQEKNTTAGHIVTLQIFLGLSDADRRVVVAAFEDGIFWRGDPIHLFHRIIKENQKMQEIGVEAYRDPARRAAERLAGRLTA